MILGSKEILQRLNNGEVFRKDTWVEKSIKEASYALRVACDGLMLGGKHYRPEKDRVEGPIEIEPGKIAILSTLEQLNMPDDLVGKIGIRFDYASIGLTGLMGIQVDPLFGRDYDKERLYIRVANLGNVKISIPLCDEVFTLELHQVTGGVQQASRARVPIWHRIQENLAGQPDPSWSYVTRVQSELSEKAANLDERLESETKNIRDYLQPVVMFGIFLLAVTILGVVLAVILNVREVATVTVPSWVSTGGWVLLLLTLSIAAISTAAMGFLMIRRLFREE
ncbi:MAG: hypothetical protein OXI80_08140 [Caldilineaceae bacterium]|nr:hypothetical protein [Caldilineaceae bacterium]